VVAFACATPEVNAQVVIDCRERGVWVNTASAPTEGDFALPAVVRCGAFTLAAGTGGASPALARRVREKLEREFDAAFADWVRVLAEVRGTVLATVADEVRRRELLDSFADWHWLSRLRAEGADAVLAAMRKQVDCGPGISDCELRFERQKAEED
jgi:precorrin-2 dehydrogenase/sirohydrochlorin ferrochelatase